MSSNFDWLKSYRDMTSGGNLEWYDFNVDEKKRNSVMTNSLEEHEVTTIAKAKYPNGREVNITLKYRYYYDVSTYGSMSELKITLSLYVSDNKKLRITESKTFAHKDFYAKPPVQAPKWFHDARNTLAIVVDSRKKSNTKYLQKLDKDGLDTMNNVFKSLP